MYRDDSEAAWARVRQLEAELARLRAGAGEHDQADDKRIGELEAQIEELRSGARPAPRRRVLTWGRLIGVLIALVLLVVLKPFWVGLVEITSPAAGEALYRFFCGLGSTQDCFYKGVMAHRRGDLAAAEAAYVEACTDDNADACNNLASLVKKRDAAEHRRLKEKACGLGSALGCGDLAVALDEAGEREQALKLGREACDKGSHLSCANLAWILLRARRIDEALNTALEASKADPEQPAAHLSLGLVLVTRADPEGAVAALRRTVALSRAPRTNGELWTHDEPIEGIIRGRLEELGLIYTERADTIHKVLNRRPEWMGEVPLRDRPPQPLPAAPPRDADRPRPLAPLR